MPRDGRKTREKILDAAQVLVLHRGFAGTSVDEIQRAAGISRGTFFYHFPSKDHMARALIERYAEVDRALVDGFMARAEALTADPLQQAMIFVALHEDFFREVAEDDAGCLFASYSYEAGVIDADTHTLVTDSIGHWRSVLGGKLEEALRKHGPVEGSPDPVLLADFGYSTLQGAFILRRSLEDPGLMADHIRQFRRYLALLFGVEDRSEALMAPDADAA